MMNEFDCPPQPDDISCLKRSLTQINYTTLVLFTNTTGLGEMRVVNTGTLGWSPLENVHVEVEAAPNQDTFAVGVDLCFILARPDMKDGVTNIFCPPVRGMSMAGGASVGL